MERSRINNFSRESKKGSFKAQIKKEYDNLINAPSPEVLSNYEMAFGLGSYAMRHALCAMRFFS